MNVAFSLLPTGAQARAELSMSLFDIARRLGQADRSVPWLSRYVQQLIDHDGFPRPLPLYRSGVNITAIGERHRWTRDGVIAWFDTFLPPALAAVVDDQRMAEAATLLDARAEAMIEQVAA